MQEHRGLQFKELVRLSLRTFKTKPLRAALTILGMAIGIGTVLFLISLGYGLQYILIGKLITTQDSLITMEVSYPVESNIFIKQDVLDSLKAEKDVAEISPIAEFPGELTIGSTTGFLVDTLIVQPRYFTLTGSLPSIGEIPGEGENGAIMSSQTFAPLNMQADASVLGKAFDLNVLYQDDTQGVEEVVKASIPVPIKGILSDDSMQPTVIIFANSLSKEPPFYRKVLVKAKDINVLESLRDKLLSQGFIVNARVDLVNQARKITNIITMVLGVFGITALIVSAIGMFNTMIVGFMERIYEVGILKSLGATDGDVRNLFLMESTIMGALGGAGGVAIGVDGGQIFNLILSAVAVKFGGKAIALFMTPWWFILLIMLISLFIGFMSGFWPATRATKLSPKEAFTRK